MTPARERKAKERKARRDAGLTLLSKWVPASRKAEILAVIDGALAGSPWLPIETAPRDGAWFRARTAHGTERTVHFADKSDRYPISHDGAVWSTAPTEWAALSGAQGGEVDPPCTDCDDTGITHQTERYCTCETGIAAAAGFSPPHYNRSREP